MKSYTFKVIVEPGEDRWQLFARPESEGATSWGHTSEDGKISDGRTAVPSR